MAGRDDKLGNKRKGVVVDALTDKTLGPVGSYADVANGGQTAKEEQQPQAIKDEQPTITEEPTKAPSYADIFNEAKEANKPTFDSLREQSAKDLLDSNIQTELARAAATKSLGTRMAAMGLGDSGYAGVAAGNIQNAYMQGMQGNKATYQDALRGIAMQEETQAKNDANVQQQRIWQLQDQEKEQQYKKDLIDYQQALTEKSNDATASTYRTETAVNNIMASIGQGNSDTLMKEQLASLGIDYYVGEGGRIELKGEGLANLSQGEQDSIKNALISKYEKENPPLTSFEQLNSAGYKLPNGNGVDRIKDELDFLFTTKDGKALAKDGTLVKLENGNNNTDHMFLQYVRGGWRQVSEANAGNNYTLIKKGQIYKEKATNTKPSTEKTTLSNRMNDLLDQLEAIRAAKKGK